MTTLNQDWTFCLISVVCLCVSFSDGAGVTNVYTLDDCVRIGLENSGRAQNARRDQAIAAAQVTQTRAEALPQVSVDANYTRLDETEEIDLGDGPIEMGSLDSYSVAANVNQLLYGGGRVGAALRSSRLSRTYADYARTEVESKLILDIRLAFFGVLLAREGIKVREESAKQLEALVAQTRQKEDQGAASEFDRLNAEVKLANEKPRLIEAKNRYDLAVEDIRRLLGLGDAPFELKGALQCVDVRVDSEDLKKRALEKRSAILAMDALVRLRKENVTAVKSAARPSVNAFASYNGANAYRFVSFSDEWEWHWNAGITFSWNVWDGRLTRGATRESELEYQKAATDLDEFKKSVVLEVRQAYLDYHHAREAVVAGSRSVALAEKALAIGRARLKSGMSTTLEFTDANLGLNSARLMLLQAQAEQMKALARLEHATGGPISRRP